MKSKYIENVTIHYAGEKAAGIASATFSMEVYFDLSDMSDDSGEKHSILKRIRKQISDLYEEMHGDPPTFVMFDFESEAQNKKESELSENNC